MPPDTVFPTPNWLLVPYIANILILVPVCYSLIASGDTANVFQNRVENSDGLRLLVASLYLAILAASVAGLVYPSFFAPVLIVQVFYKSVWLMLFVVPNILRANPVPEGISTTFAIIVVTYPVFLLLAAR